MSLWHVLSMIRLFSKDSNSSTLKYFTYYINILMRACVIFKFPQTYFTGRCCDIFQPDTGGVPLQSSIMMCHRHKNKGLLGELALREKKTEFAA